MSYVLLEILIATQYGVSLPTNLVCGKFLEVVSTVHYFFMTIQDPSCFFAGKGTGQVGTCRAQVVFDRHTWPQPVQNLEWPLAHDGIGMYRRCVVSKIGCVTWSAGRWCCVAVSILVMELMFRIMDPEPRTKIAPENMTFQTKSVIPAWVFFAFRTA